MLTHIVQLAWIIIAATVIWFGLLVRWVERNPEWADQVRRHACPRPWFFKVWTTLFIIGCVCVGFLVCYYIITYYLLRS